jgi:hypothetical protein
MTKERVLIAVKTYPTLSKSYTELVCTAGFREDGSWVRIYPSPFRFLNDTQRYQKYQWIELDLAKNLKDVRPESFNPTNIDAIELHEKIGTEREWEKRRDLILNQNQVFTNLAEIIAGAKSNEMSLAVFKPTKVLDFSAESVAGEWELSKKEAALEARKQGSLFDETDWSDFKIVRKLPWKFKYRFIDDAGKEATLMIEDWEVGQLYWNCEKGRTPEEAVAMVRRKYFDDFVKTKDLYFFLGTTREWHQRALNPYVIVGTFHPPFQTQIPLL